MKTLLLLLLFPVTGYTQGQKILQQDYSLPLSDNEITTLHQSNDTLYEWRCYIDKACQSEPFRHYKIISSLAEGDETFLKLEQLDTIPYPAESLPVTRYSVLVLKEITEKKLSYLPLVSGLTRKQLDTYPTNVQTMGNKVSFTFFSSACMKELSTLKKVTTKDEAKQIVDAYQRSNFQPLEGNLSDEIYTTRFLAELLNNVCIEKGFNPIGAGKTIEQLIK
jgi:hypothetical protein